MNLSRLDREIFGRDALFLAEYLLGKLLVRRFPEGDVVLRIVETEAYTGPEDKASHAFGNKRTPRTETMFMQGGAAYVYLIYGMYNCLNVTTGPEGRPEAVLIRAGEPVSGLDIMERYRSEKKVRPENLSNGPGKLCLAMDITREFDRYDLIGGEKLFLAEDNCPKPGFLTCPRINIDYAEEYRDKPWRFYVHESRYVSRKGRKGEKK